MTAQWPARARIAVAIASSMVTSTMGLTALVAAQTPARDAGATAIETSSSATATLAGTITSADAQPQPLPAAVIEIYSATTGGLKTVTDDEGKFAFPALAPESYTLTVTKPAYLKTEFGATRIGGAGTPITLAAGQRLTDVVVKVPRGSVITGTIFDLDGAPAPNLNVSVIPAAPGGAAITDDRGVYRIYGLAPDDYLVMAAPSSSSSGGATMMTASGVDAALADLERTHGRGGGAAIAGSTLASTSRSGGTPASAIGADAAKYSFAAVLYPGTISRDAAVRVTVHEAEERGGIDFPLMLFGTTKASGIVMGPDGQPAYASPGAGVTSGATPLAGTMLAVTINPRVSTGAVAPGLRAQIVTNAKDSTFQVSNLTPGAYTILARVLAPVAPRLSQGTEPITPPVRQMTFWAVADIDVSNADLSGLTLILRPALSMTGRIVFDRTTNAIPADLSRIRVGLTRAAPAPGEQADAPVTTTTRPDGTFEIAGIMPGSYQVTAALPPATSAGWWLRSAMLNGRDLLDAPPVVGQESTDFTGVVLTFSDRHTEVAGRLETPAGAPAPSHFIVALPVDRTLWNPLSRRLAFTRPATDGRFAFRDLPAGDYLLVALTDLDARAWKTTDFLDQLVPGGVRITVREGGRTSQDLRIAK